MNSPVSHSLIILLKESTGGVSAFPWVALPFITPFTYNSNFTFSVTNFYFFVALSSLLASLSFSHGFCKMSHGFIIGRQGGNTTAFFAFCTRIEEQIHSGQSLTDSERSETISHWPWCASVIRMLICGFVLAGQFIFYAITQFICHVNWNLNSVVGGLVLSKLR